MNKRMLFLPLVPALSAVALAATPALAASSSEGISENWAGYEVSPNNPNSNGFTNVQGSWVQPSAKCTNGTATYSAFWVGIGGGSQESSALEQTGTQADCSASGQASYFAWYELVPSAPVRLGLQVSPGDKISAAVKVNGSSVTVTLLDNTTGNYVNKTLQMSSPDTSTAEWIAEAPSNCQGGADGQCTPLPLADFGSVGFTGASATADGHTGAINDSAWTDEPLALDSSQDALDGGGDGFGFADTSSSTSSGSTAAAQPSGLTNNGSSFSVSYDANGLSQDVSTQSSAGGDGGGGYGGSGYSGGSGYPYSDGGYGYGGDGYSDGGYGYSDGGYGYGGDGYSDGGYGYGGDGSGRQWLRHHLLSQHFDRLHRKHLHGLRYRPAVAQVVADADDRAAGAGVIRTGAGGARGAEQPEPDCDF